MHLRPDDAGSGLAVLPNGGMSAPFTADRSSVRTWIGVGNVCDNGRFDA